MTTLVKTDLNLWTEAKKWVETLPEEIRELPYDFLSDPEPNDQLVATYCICSGKFDAVTLLGRAGSGKTFVVQACRSILLMQKCEVRICASTGIAAKNAGGEGTINRFAGLKAGNSTAPEGYRDFVEGHWVRSGIAKRADNVMFNFDPSLKQDLIVFIDEAGMCSSEMLLLTYQVLKRAVPKRRIRFVLTCDFRQLLPIDKKENMPWDVYTSLAFEDAKFHFAGTDKSNVVKFGSLMMDGPFEKNDMQQWRSVQISLVKNRRQAEGSWFANALNSLGDGNDFNHADVTALTKRVWLFSREGYKNMRTQEPLPELVDAIHLYNKNADVAAHNQRALEAAKERGAEFRTYRAYLEEGAWTKDEILSEVAPLSMDMTLAVGCKFMVRTNVNEHLTNGTVGIIRKLEAKKILLELPSGEQHWLEEQNAPLPVNNRSNPVGVFRSIPGVLAHAMTPWKAQGLTIREPMVYHLNSWMQTHGLMYVVCSRVTEPEFLYIVVDNGKMLNKAVVCEPRVKQFIHRTEAVMFKALGQVVEYQPIWKKEKQRDQDLVWVRDHLVTEVPYVEKPSANVVNDSELCTIYERNGAVGMYVKDRAALGKLLVEDDEVFEWFKSTVQFVWFNPKDARMRAA